MSSSVHLLPIDRPAYERRARELRSAAVASLFRGFARWVSSATRLDRRQLPRPVLDTRTGVVR